MLNRKGQNVARPSAVIEMSRVCDLGRLSLSLSLSLSLVTVLLTVSGLKHVDCTQELVKRAQIIEKVVKGCMSKKD